MYSKMFQMLLLERIENLREQAEDVLQGIENGNHITH